MAKCSTNHSKGVQCKAVLKNEHTFCWPDTALQLLRNWLEQRPIIQDDLDSRVKEEVETIYYMWVYLLLIFVFIS
jgi:hypothetical protein